MKSATPTGRRRLLFILFNFFIFTCAAGHARHILHHILESLRLSNYHDGNLIADLEDLLVCTS